MTYGRRRVLFVDDERRVLEGLENLLFDAPDDWVLDFCTSGQEALHKMSARSFDVLVTDMRMPGMDGASLLEACRRRAPETIRLVLSGHTDEAAARRAMPLAHDFLSKPCASGTLVEAIERALSLANTFRDDAVRRALGGVESLPARCTTHLRLQDMAERGAGVAEVAAVVGTELALATKMMHIANTAFYSGGCPVEDVRGAVSRLGLDLTIKLALAVETIAAVGKPSERRADQLHRHSLQVAETTMSLVSKARASAAYLAGLLHDLGSLLIAVRFAERQPKVEELQRRGLSIVEAERRALGFDHASVGAYLLRLWKVGEDAAEAVAEHHVPGLRQRGEVSLALFAADFVAHHPEGLAAEGGFSSEERHAVEALRHRQEGSF